MLLEKELSYFNSDMYLNLILEFNNDIEFSETNKFFAEEDLRTLSVNHLMNRLEKSLSVSVDKVEKMLNRNLQASDLIRLCHIGIEIANAECESNRRRWSAKSDETSPNKRKSKEFTAKTPIQSSIPTDIDRRISEIEYSSHTGPPAEIDDNKKRWLVVGICLHSILSPTLRKYVEPVVTNLYNSLKLSDQIDKQSCNGYLKIYGAVNVKYLNYNAINNNKTISGNRTLNYDYKVHNAVDLSKLFFGTNMVHYTGFDETCDSSALLGIIVNIDQFPGNVQSAAEYVRSNIRNRWAHCNFTEWNSGMYNRSLQEVEDFINLLHLNAQEKSQTIGELNNWKTNGTSYLKDTTLGLELVNDIRQQIQLLVEYEKVICKSADAEFSKVQNELTEIGKTLSHHDKRISSLEKNVAIQETTLLKYKSLYDDGPVINVWKKKMELFVETDVVTDILEILQDNHCALLIGVSGIGKTLTAQNIALHLWREMEYSIVPCSNLNDIKMQYRDNVCQVFFVDDICGRYTTNILMLENWMNMEEFVKCILVKGKTKILATCRTEVFLEEIFQETFEIFSKTTYNLSEKYSFEDKLVIAEKYLKQDAEMLSATIRNVEFTPLMCFLYAQHEHFDINDFLNGPYETFCKEWNKLKSFDKEKYCVLFLCVLYNGTIDESIVDFSKELDKNEKKKLKDIFECCKLGRDTPRSLIKDKLNACVDTYFIKVEREFKVVHDKMFDFLCCYFGKTLIAPIIKYADDKLISERVQLVSIQKPIIEFKIVIPPTEEHKYMERLRTDLENGKMHWCLNNVQMRYEEYRYKFLDVVKGFDDDNKRRFVDLMDENGNTSFIISCLRGYNDLVLFFISVGADVDARNGWFTPLTAACRDGHLGTVEILLNKGSIVNQTNIYDETPLYTACICGHYGLAKRLIKRRADINKPNKYNHTPLYVSCMGGYENIVRLLIDEGATVCDCSDSLIGATYGGHDKIVEILVTEVCDINYVDVQGRTALFIACEEGYTKIVRLLLDKNADICKGDCEGNTPLDAARSAGNDKIVSMLIQINSNVNMRHTDDANISKVYKNELTPSELTENDGQLTISMIFKSLKTSKLVPNKGLHISEDKEKNYKEQKPENTRQMQPYGWTPLYEACTRGDMKTVQSLIKIDSNVNMRHTDDANISKVYKNELTPLELTENDGQLTNSMIFKSLKTSKLVPNLGLHISEDKEKNYKQQKPENTRQMLPYGWTPLYEACTRGDTKTVQSLIKMNANVNMTNSDGDTPLIAACQQGSGHIIDVLLNAGAEINQSLIIAIRNNYESVINILVCKGRDYGYENMIKDLTENRS